MGRVITRCTIVVAGLLLELSIAHSTGAQTTPVVNQLQPLDFLAGSCWKGTFAGRAVTDEHCFQWVYGGHFLRDHHVVRGDSAPYEGETTYAWDRAQKKIVYWYIALPGFYSQGNVEPTGDALIFHDNLATATPTQQRATWRRSGPDAYTVKVEEIIDGKSKELWSIVMNRSRAAPD